MIVTHIPTWWFGMPVAVSISREISVSALREWMAERHLRASVKVGNLGKWKTAAQMVATAFLLEAGPGNNDWTLAQLLGLSPSTTLITGMVLLYYSTVLSLISAFQYFAAAWPLLVGNTVAPTVDPSEVLFKED